MMISLVKSAEHICSDTGDLSLITKADLPDIGEPILIMAEFVEEKLDENL